MYMELEGAQRRAVVETNELLKQVLTELRVLNKYMEQILGEEIRGDEIDSW